MASQIEEARRLERQGNLAAAEDIYRSLLATDPGLTQATLSLGQLLLTADRPEDARDVLEAGIGLDPTNGPLHFLLATALQQCGRPAAAVAQLQGLLQQAEQGRQTIGPRNLAATLNNLGNLHWELNQENRAEAAWRRACELAPDLVPALSSLGMCYTMHGEFERAQACLREAIRLDPDFANAYYYLSQCATFCKSSPEIGKMEQLLEEGSRSSEERSRIAFGLGKIYEDLAHRNRTFIHWELANRLHREHVNYDLQKDLILMRKIQRLFANAMWPRAKPTRPRPIFILGMPRSGTSLTEQILASHPLVQAGGELETLGDLLRAAVNQYPEDLDKLTPTEWQALGQRYLAAITPVAAGHGFVTDKLPMNFMHIGMIRMMLPEARIVHCRRDPIDTCFSCFKKPLLEPGVAYCSDLADLGAYFAHYEWLMAHWHHLLPGWIYDSDYEQLTQDLEGNVRRLLEFCGLDFAPECLIFHRTRTRINTASATQVREPIHRKSIGSARPYMTELAPLIRAREQHLATLTR